MKGFRTIAYGLLIAGLALLSNDAMVAFFAEHLPWVGGFVGTGIVALRALTNSPIFKKWA